MALTNLELGLIIGTPVALATGFAVGYAVGSPSSKEQALLDACKAEGIAPRPAPPSVPQIDYAMVAGAARAGAESLAAGEKSKADKRAALLKAVAAATAAGATQADKDALAALLVP